MCELSFSLSIRSDNLGWSSEEFSVVDGMILYNGCYINYCKFTMMRLIQQTLLNHKIHSGIGHFMQSIAIPDVYITLYKNHKVVFNAITHCDYTVDFTEMDEYEFDRNSEILPDIYEFVWNFVDDMVNFCG